MGFSSVNSAIVWSIVAGAALAYVAGLAHRAEAQLSPRGEWTQRTPWGDLNLQGEWTSEGEFGVPLERPRKFGTRRVPDR